jgi:SAM-dependent methyltransferase
MEEQLELLIDLHLDGERQGPGSDDATRLAIRLAGLEGATGLRIADIGCGTGASTLVLARDLDAHITAVDLLPPFLVRLEQAARERDLADRITTLAASMDQLGFDDGSLDVIWSEGAIYNIGFEHGIRSWRRFLKPGGIIAVSEITWLTRQRPKELEDHWNAEYPDVATAATKLAVLEAAGYTPLGYFPLPESCWIDHYYRPMQARFAPFLEGHDGSDAAREIVDAERHEIDLYERHAHHVSYGFYIASRNHDGTAAVGGDT